MKDIAYRLPMMREMRRKHLQVLRANASSPERDRDGTATGSLIGTVRFLAVADYVLDRDVTAFRSGIAEAASLRQDLINRFDSGEPISPSYVSMTNYKALFNALASGDMGLARSLAAKMGGRESIEHEYDRAFDAAMGYALKNVLMNHDGHAWLHVEALESACQGRENSDFEGYARLLRATMTGNAHAGEEALALLIAGHKRQSHGHGLFKDTEDALLCVWGIGLVNLARMRGLPIGSHDSLVPAELLMK